MQDQDVMIYLIQEHGVMTILGRNVNSFEFSDCWQLLLCQVSQKKVYTFNELIFKDSTGIKL